MGIFNIFIKKENTFLLKLNQMACKAFDASVLLVAFMKTGPSDPNRELYNAQIKTIEKEADKVYDDIFNALNVTFITPFDREDIQALAAKLDDVLDFINGISKRTTMYQVGVMPDEFVRMAEIIRDQCLSLKNSMEYLGKITKNAKVVTEECNKIHVLETEADELYTEFVIKLFREAKDPIELVKLNKVVQYLENATDVTEDVADVLRTIIVKYN
jgi:uncharacterized protein